MDVRSYDSPYMSERDRIEREMLKYDSRRLAEKQAQAHEQLRRTDLERDITAKVGELFDITHARADRASTRSITIAARMSQCRNYSADQFETVLTHVTKELAAAVKRHDGLWRSTRDSLRRQYWSRITEDDRELLAHTTPESSSKTTLRNKHAALAEEHMQLGVTKIGADAGIIDLERALIGHGPDGLSEHTSWHGGESCPVCDSALEDRTRAVDGGSFTGCSTWPKCGFAWSPMWGATTAAIDGFDNMVNVIASVYEAKAAWRLAREAGPIVTDARTTDDPVIAWRKVLRAADEQGRVKQLLDIVMIEYAVTSSPQGRKIAAAWQSWKHGRAEVKHAAPAKVAPKEKKMSVPKRYPAKSVAVDKLRQLSARLAELFTLSEAASMCRAAGMDSSTGVHMHDVDITGADVRWPVANGWCQLLEQAEAQGRLEQLRRIVINAIPQSTDWLRVDTLWCAWRESNACTGDAPLGMIAKKDVEENIMAESSVSSIKGSTEKSKLDSIVDIMVATTKEDGEDAAWLTAADEALEIGKPVARQIVREFAGPGPIAKKALAMIDSPIGEGAVAWTMGWAIMGYGPLRGKELGARTMRLSKALRVRGLKPLTDVVGKKFIRPISKRLTTLIEGLPNLVGEG